MAVKSVSVPDDVKRYLDSLPNASKYVTDLVRRDMEDNPNDLDAKIRRIVEQYLGGQVKPNESDEVLKGKIDQLLDM